MQHVEVFEKLLDRYLNCKTGMCFPSYATIAEVAGISEDCAAEAIRRLDIHELLIKHRRRTTHHKDRRAVEAQDSNLYEFVPISSDPVFSALSRNLDSRERHEAVLAEKWRRAHELTDRTEKEREAELRATGQIRASPWPTEARSIDAVEVVERVLSARRLSASLAALLKSGAEETKDGNDE